MSNSSIREKIAEIVKENADRILALFPQEPCTCDYSKSAGITLKKDGTCPKCGG